MGYGFRVSGSGVMGLGFRVSCSGVAGGVGFCGVSGLGRRVP